MRRANAALDRKSNQLSVERWFESPDGYQFIAGFAAWAMADELGAGLATAMMPNMGARSADEARERVHEIFVSTLEAVLEALLAQNVLDYHHSGGRWMEIADAERLEAGLRLSEVSEEFLSLLALRYVRDRLR